MRVQSILLPDEICNVEELYFHRNRNRIDFDGYFNLFYIEKRLKYTNYSGLNLCLRLCGYKVLYLMHDQKVIQTIYLEENETKEYSIPFPYGEINEGVFWFSLEKSESEESASIEGYFEGVIREEDKKHPEIVVDICTFRREDYVAKNLKTMTERIFQNHELEVSAHLRVFVIDNGQTLSDNRKIQELIKQSQEKITVFPNINTGGAGGFTRGMLEALRIKDKEKITHVLLMDDDAVFAPDLFVRVYGFLAGLKEKYRDITVGGALLREDYPYIQHACGEWLSGFAVENENPLVDLRQYTNCTAEFMCTTSHAHDRYSGWWCCCYSLNTVREDNLPWPLFIHHDDIEFGIRNAKTGIVFLNGVGVWHKGFELTFAGINRYYDVRNTLISTALCGEKTKWQVKKWIWKCMTGALIEFRYTEAGFVYRALLDFCRGPQWLSQIDAEKLNNFLRSQIVLQPIENLKEKLTDREYQDIIRQINLYRDHFGLEKIREYYTPERRKGSLLKKLTFNGWILPAKKENPLAISALDSPFLAFRRRRIVLFEPITGKAEIAEKNNAFLLRIFRLYIKVSIAIDHFYDRAVEDYRERNGEFTSKEAWERYLRIEENGKN